MQVTHLGHVAVVVDAVPFIEEDVGRVGLDLRLGHLLRRHGYPPTVRYDTRRQNITQHKQVPKYATTTETLVRGMGYWDSLMQAKKTHT